MPRIEFVDCAKGFAIILMVFLHIEIDSPQLIYWITSFHIPIFFLATGYISPVIEPLSMPNEKSNLVISKIKKRFIQLMLPYFAFCIGYALFYTILGLFSSSSFSPINIFVLYLKDTVNLVGFNALWFLPCMYLADILFYATVASKSV